MTQAMSTLVNQPAWVDLSSSDAQGSRDFYARVFGWSVEVNPDPLYGGYGMAKLGGHDVAGIGPTQNPGQPTAWNVYIGSDDLAALAARVQDAGGTVVETGQDPMVDLVSIHRAAVRLANARGLDPEQPAHLSRAVVL